MPVDRIKPHIFETDFAHFEQNRMYPLGYRRESAMLKLTLDHVAAISRAEGYIHPAIIPNMSPNHRKNIEDDLTRLAEIKKFILKYMYEPGLPHGNQDPADTDRG